MTQTYFYRTFQVFTASIQFFHELFPVATTLLKVRSEFGCGTPCDARCELLGCTVVSLCVWLSGVHRQLGFMDDIPLSLNGVFIHVAGHLLKIKEKFEENWI